MNSLWPLRARSHSHGVQFEFPELTVFFGDHRSDSASLELHFPELEFASIRQVHSDKVLESPGDLAREGDAHFTNRRMLALTVRTADCLPILLYEPNTNFIAAIHAGWRGIEGEIIQKTCAVLKSKGATPENARAWIGPHIRKESFEVGEDVAQRLVARFEAVRGFARVERIQFEAQEPGKSKIDLSEIARAQLRSQGIGSSSIVELPIDTLTSSEHCSFRRDRERAGRQISFIALR